MQKRNPDKTIHLNLVGKWFDMIFEGLKPEEYRDMSQYWAVRLEQNDAGTVTFSNGYHKDRRQFRIELLEIEKGTGNPDWGAVPGKDYYILKLGKILTKNF